MKQFLHRPVVVMLVALATACTLKKEEAPEFAGPSEFGTSISISVTPDVIQQDGASQSVVTVTARGPNGQPLSNLPLRAEILVNGVRADFGSLSARNIVTGSDGRASLTFTAPAAPPGLAVDTGTVVEIGVTPLGNDFANAATRFAAIRLVPTGIIVVPANLSPAFTFTPTTPAETQTVVFDASTSQAPANNPIVSFTWDFGDGGTGSGRTASHAFNEAGTFVVSLTVSDSLGRTAQTSQAVTVTPVAGPAANFVFSPAAPVRNTTVTFNASGTTASPGRRIVSYSWDFGDPAAPAAGNGVQTNHVFALPGSYNVTLVVTDDLGRTSSVTRTVTVT
jgi:hypothetical protein